ncbi:XrtA system polysaccharide deacetylase [Candidatus Omnitrophota bacterium]
MLNALSFDLEEWYHLCGLKHPPDPKDWSTLESRVVINTRKLLNILAQEKTRATFFVLGYIAQKYPELVKEIDTHGHEIGTHGFWHHLIYQQGKEAFKEDLKNSIAILQKITGKKVLGHRAASFSITQKSLWALEILAEVGIKYDCSVFPIHHPRYGIVAAPRFPYKIRPDLDEFPPTTARICGVNLPVAGGIGLRMLPYFLLKQTIKTINKQGLPGQIYIHPWEIDSLRPPLDVPFNRKFTHYANLGCVIKKLRALLDDFQFGPIKEVLKIE